MYIYIYIYEIYIYTRYIYIYEYIYITIVDRHSGNYPRHWLHWPSLAITFNKPPLAYVILANIYQVNVLPANVFHAYIPLAISSLRNVPFTCLIINLSTFVPLPFVLALVLLVNVDCKWLFWHTIAIHPYFSFHRHASRGWGRAPPPPLTPLTAPRAFKNFYITNLFKKHHKGFSWQTPQKLFLASGRIF